MYQGEKFDKSNDPTKMHDDLAILEKFIDFGNHSLLIQGETGTGKLTLCFELANLMQEKYEIYFITKSQNNEKIFRRARWIKNFLSPTNIVDIYAKGDSKFNEDFEVYEYLNAVSTMATLINDPFISENIKKPFIIMDAWNTTVDHIDPKKVTQVEKILLSMIEKNDGFIIFLSEEYDKSSIETTVDGVISLIQERIELFKKRKMIFKKLNGMSAVPPSVPFSLHQGRLRTFSRLKNKRIIHPSNFVPILNSNEKYSTGNYDFDKKLDGGFKKGSVIGFEIDESVDRFVFVPLFAPLVLNFLSQNNPALIISPPDQDINALTNYLSPYIEKSKYMEKLRVIGHSHEGKTDLTNEENYLDFKPVQKKIMENYSYFKQKNLPTLLQMDCSLLELAYYKNFDSIQNSIVHLSRYVRTKNDLLILSSRPNYKSSNIIKSLSDLYFTITNFEGTIFLSTEKPKLFLANIQSNFEKGYPNMELLESA